MARLRFMFLLGFPLPHYPFLWPLPLFLFYISTALDMHEILLRTGAKTAAEGEQNRDEKGIALIMLNNSRDSGAAAPLALTCAEDA